MKKTAIGICVGAVLCGLALYPAAPARIMLLDGESGGPYHKWPLPTPVLPQQLEEPGLFQVDVVTAPPADGGVSSGKPEGKKDAAVGGKDEAPDNRGAQEGKTS